MQPAPTSAKRSWQQVLGPLLIGTGLLGMLLSLAGLIVTLVISAAAEGALQRELNTLGQALTTTAGGLELADTTLVEVQSTLSSLELAILGATEAVRETGPTIITLETLTGENLPETITATRQALSSAQATAQIVDRVLGGLTFVGVNYNPEVPLAQSISEVNDSLAPIPASLGEVATGLATTGENLDQLSRDLAEVADGIAAIESSLGEARTIISSYQTVVADLQAELEHVRAAAPAWFIVARSLLILLLLWLGLSQIGLLVQGRDLLMRGKVVD